MNGKNNKEEKTREFTDMRMYHFSWNFHSYSQHIEKLSKSKTVLSIRVSLKNKNVFLSPGDFTPSAFLYEESKTPIARLY